MVTQSREDQETDKSIGFEKKKNDLDKQKIARKQKQSLSKPECVVLSSECNTLLNASTVSTRKNDRKP